jgi:hypothetical protein
LGEELIPSEIKETHMSTRWIRSVFLFLILLAALSPLSAAQVWEVRDLLTNQIIPPGATTQFQDIATSNGDRVYTLKNVSGFTGTVELSGCQLNGHASFSILVLPHPNNGTAHVFPGQTINMTIRHAPQAIGTHLTEVHCGGSGPVFFKVQGRVLDTVPRLILEDASGQNVPKNSTYEMGSVPAGTPLNRQLRIVNFGNQPLSVGLSNPDAPFSVSGVRSSIAAGGQATFNVQLLSESAGTFSRQLTITNNDPNDNPYTITLRGTVTSVSGGSILVRDGNNDMAVTEGSTVNLGSTAVNTPLLRTFRIENLSQKARLTIQNPNSFLSGNLDRFFVHTSPASIVEPGQSTSFVIRFQSSTNTDSTTNVSLATSDPNNSTYTFAIRASTASASGPQILVFSDGMELGLGSTALFGSVAPNQTVTKSFDLINNGGSNLILSNVEVFPASSYSLVTSPGTPVGPNGQTPFSIRFLGKGSAGIYEGSLLLYHNDPTEANPLLISLSTQVQVVEPTVSLSTPDNLASEWGLSAPSPGRITLTRNNVNLALPLDVQVGLSGTAAIGGDYTVVVNGQTYATGPTLNLQFGGGQNSLTLDLQPINDSTVEDVETATFTLADGANYALGAAKTGTVSIYNDDYTPCTTGGTQLCLRNGRFKVQLTGQVEPNFFPGQAIPLNLSTGGFWLFSPGNVELGVKVLEAPDHTGFWVYYGAATDVDYTFTVIDLANVSKSRSYESDKPYCGGGDVGAFLRSVALPPTESLNGGGFEMAAEPQIQSIHQAACVPDATTSCLLNGRFQMKVWYNNPPTAPAQAAAAVPVTGETAFFWFFSPDNLEIFAKVLDGTAINQKYWVYFGSMTDVPFTLEITDTVTGASKTYDSTDYDPLCGFGDAFAF